MQRQEYRTDIDAIKGLAIIAVILYHVGMLPYGFLGVDAFLVINGFLIIPALIRQLQTGEFRFFPWLAKRIYRLWPIVLAASVVCLAIGYWIMIPDSYENLAESVVASNIFANNILSAITTANYWDVANEYKPLMQMWYIGVIVQFYVLYPLVLIILSNCMRKYNNRNHFWIAVVAVLGAISLGLYLLFPDSFSNKFYFVQYRVWEFSIGGLVGLIINHCRISAKSVAYVGYALLCLLFLIGVKSISQVNTMTVIGMEINPESNTLKMALVVTIAILSGVILLTNIKWGGVFPKLGKMSLSLFVWHQVILAFVRYGFIETFNWLVLIIYLIATLVVAFVSYRLIEQIRAKTTVGRFIIFGVFILTTGYAYAIYRNAGVVRDVPELGITTDNPFVNRNTEYTDQIYKLPKTFSSTKPHVLVVGNSFARDFACILKEYDVDEKLEMAYSFDFGSVDSLTLSKTDYLFAFGAKSRVPANVFSYINPSCRTFGIGTKSYGKNFGIFYAKRNSPDYFNQTIEANALVDSINSRWRDEWGTDNFIDIMEATKSPDGKVRIFTPENKVISFDCRHLTQDGCKFYSTRLKLKKIFNQKKQ